MKLITALFAAGLFMTACNTQQAPPTATADPNVGDTAIGEVPPEELEDYWAKDNFDLGRVGSVLERSSSPEEFEQYLNDDGGVNNLDLNGDGYVDYISVREFDDGGPNERGLSLFSRFGPDLIQEVAQIFFYRDDLNYPGSRVYIRGDDRLYGDNYYYETNWLDRAIPLVTMLFTDRDRYYSSPYYYDNYPPDYVVYDVVETPIYRTRIERLYPEPVFVFTAAPAFFDKVKIKSPNNGLHLGQVYARLAKPSKEQVEFIKNNPRAAKVGKFRGDDKPGRDDPPRSDRGDERGNPARDDRGAERGNPGKPAGKPDRGQGQGQGQGQGKAQGQGQGEGKPEAKGQGQSPGQGKGKPDKGQGQGSGQGKGGGQGKGKKP